MRSLRSLLLVAFMACHAAVTLTGPSLHDWFGQDHGTSWGPAAPGHGTKLIGQDGDDCAACHLLSLAQHQPDTAFAHSAPRIERVAKPFRTSLPPRESGTIAPPRAPPAPSSHLSRA